MYFSIYLHTVLPISTCWITCIKGPHVYGATCFLNSLIIDLLTYLINGWISISKYLYIKRIYLCIFMLDMYHILYTYRMKIFKHRSYLYISILHIQLQADYARGSCSWKYHMLWLNPRLHTTVSLISTILYSWLDWNKQLSYWSTHILFVSIH
jgi:hypothetical protein